MLFAPLEGWRHVTVTPHRAAIDYAHVLQQLSDVHFPKAESIILVQDNLNTHTPASLYRAFPSVLARQCLDRRIPDIATLDEQVSAWLQQRNKHHAKADWRFTTEDARIRLKNLYPVL